MRNGRESGPPHEGGGPPRVMDAPWAGISLVELLLSRARLRFTLAQLILLDDGEFGIPGGIILEHGVENDEQLAQAGGENDLGLFACSTRGGLRQSQGKRSDVFVAAFSAEGGHVQGIPDGAASSADGSDPHELSTLVIEGSHADQCGNLLAIELSPFGEFGQESRRRGDSDARHGGHEVDLVLPVVVITNEFVDLILDGPGED